VGLRRDAATPARRAAAAAAPPPRRARRPRRARGRRPRPTASQQRTARCSHSSSWHGGAVRGPLPSLLPGHGLAQPHSTAQHLCCVLPACLAAFMPPMRRQRRRQQLQRTGSPSGSPPRRRPVVQGGGGGGGGDGDGDIIARVVAPGRLFGPVPRYTVDLDAAPERRWDAVGHDYAASFHRAIEEIEPFFETLLGRRLVAALLLLAGAAVWLRLFPHARELRGLSRTTGVPVAKLALVQLIYEATSACTSVVVQNRCPPLGQTTIFAYPHAPSLPVGPQRHWMAGDHCDDSLVAVTRRGDGASARAGRRCTCARWTGTCPSTCAPSPST
jgi:hypothetical protein